MAGVGKMSQIVVSLMIFVSRKVAERAEPARTGAAKILLSFNGMVRQVFPFRSPPNGIAQAPLQYN
jgi:hypothetical protein